MSKIIKINKKLLSTIMAVIMFLGCFTAFAGMPAYAAEGDEEVFVLEDYTAIVYANPDEKLATMEKVVESYGYELWYKADTGETAVLNTKTGQILLSNPYDVASDTTSSVETKQKLLSQLIIKYTENDKETSFDSYKQAAMNGQIKMKKIKGGIRVEYTIGKEEKRKLVPRMIEQTSFEENILQYITNEREHKKMEAYYTLKNANDPTLTERARKELQVSYPITKFMAIYIFDPNASDRELTEIEGYIKKNTKYTFEMMDEDHQKVEHEPKDKAPPLFKMALEYYIDEDGLYVRLPANGIRFDESTYRLADITVLPYMGAGRRGNTGYTFIPDGSGSIVRFEDIKDTTLTLTNKVYGPDYSFYKISGTHTQKWRLPVFGTVENYVIKRSVTTDVEEIVPESIDVDGNIIPETTVINSVTVVEEEPRQDGFIAIIEEGDSMAEISTDHGAKMHIYNTSFTKFTPRPTDQYNLNAASTGLNSLMMVSSRRKYAGNYIVRYIMLSGEKASYIGMAEAYRNYLEKKGTITKLEDTGEDIPLYIETFGMIQVQERILGFPYAKDTPMTTFEDIQTMIDTLNENNITNINFKMRGWENNGMVTYNPAKVKIEKVLGGKKGLQELITYANSKGATVYPEIDFVLAPYWSRFDGFNRKKNLARCMDDTFSWEQLYWYLPQAFTFMTGKAIISSNAITGLYEKAMKEYLKLDIGAISSVSLGKELHSDQNKKKLLNREESKAIIIDLLARMKEENNKLIVDAGNVYSLKYADAVLNASLDSSRFLGTSNSIPFYGMVTHGYVNVAGTPINLAGDYSFELLKAIENGTNPYFILSYQNTYALKEYIDMFNMYYAIDFKTTLNDLVEIYHTLNDALKPLRTKVITGHEFLNGDYNLVKVTYEGGTSFILNYNNTTVTAEGHEVEPMSFVKVN